MKRDFAFQFRKIERNNFFSPESKFFKIRMEHNFILAWLKVRGQAVGFFLVTHRKRLTELQIKINERRMSSDTPRSFSHFFKSINSSASSFASSSANFRSSAISLARLMCLRAFSTFPRLPSKPARDLRTLTWLIGSSL